MGWNEMERGRRFMEDDFEQDEVERAYRKDARGDTRKPWKRWARKWEAMANAEDIPEAAMAVAMVNDTAETADTESAVA